MDTLCPSPARPDQEPTTVSTPFSTATTERSVTAARGFVADVFGWMFLGLAITAGVAAIFSSSQNMVDYTNEHSGVVIGVLIAQLALVFGLIFLINKISAAVARLIFCLYAGTIGFTFALLFQVYTTGSIVSTFVVTAGMFGGAAAYGWITKRDLTIVGQIAFMALIGIILALLVNLLLQSSTLDYVVSGIGVLVFTALTAYDMQKIKQTAAMAQGDTEATRKASIFGALMLYLDFINIFLFLLRFLGNAR
jgi:FtsH-binding integral membrane protein